MPTRGHVQKTTKDELEPHLSGKIVYLIFQNKANLNCLFNRLILGP